MRQGEALGLSWNDVDTGAGTLTVRQALQRIDGRMRAGPDWEEWGLLFTSPTGCPLHGTTVTKQFQARLAAAGLPRTRFHDLRHGAASFMLAQGLPPTSIQEVLGHSAFRVTQNV